MPWSSIKTEAVVLSAMPVREADRRYSLLTPSHGKLSVLGRGAQKRKAKLASHLEPFAVVDIEVIRGRRSMTVISVDRKYGFAGVGGSFERRLLAASSLSLLDRYTREEDTDPALYQELVDWLRFLDKGGELRQARSTFLLGGFLLRVLKRLGYQAQLTHCLDCKEEILPLSFRWHSGHGGLVCTDCVQVQKRDWHAAGRINEETVKLIRFARDRRYTDLLRPPLAGGHVEEFARVVQDLLVYHVPGSPQTPFWAGVLAGWRLEEPAKDV